MQYNEDFISSKPAKEFTAKLFEILTGCDADGKISKEVWAKNEIMVRKAMRSEWAGVYQSFDIYKSLGSMHFKSEAEMIERTCNTPIRRLFADHIVYLRDQEGWELNWWTFDHYMFDVLNSIEGDWAFRLIPRDDD